jgi:enamine deaminase RidA (YjgF/YER057c/UK114 family)
VTPPSGFTERFTDDARWQELAGYSRAVRRGNIIMVSGTTAAGPDGSVLHPGDTGAQALECLRRIERALTALGSSLAEVVRTVVYLAPGASWEQAARAHRDVLGEVAPANTMLYVGGLIGDGFLVEIEATAVAAR